MLKGENWWTWERAMEHALHVSDIRQCRMRVHKTNTSIGWTVTYAHSRPR